MKNEKEIQAKIDELQKGVDALENLLIKTEDAKVRETYMQTRKDVQQDIRTLGMKNALLILPVLAFEWEKGKGKTITIGWLNKTYSVTWGCTIKEFNTKER